MTQQIYTTPTPFSGTNISIPNSGKGYTSNMLIKGKTYQNLVTNGQQETELYVSVDTQAKYQYVYELKNNTDYTLIFTANNVSDTNTVISFNGGNLGIERKILNGVNIVKTHTNDKDKYLSVWFYYNNGITSDKVSGTIKNVMLLEGDWTNKEIPSSITGIESVGEKENNKISILSHGKNLFNKNNVDRIKGLWFDLGSNKIKKDGEAIYSAFTDYVKEGKQYKISYKIFNSASLRYSYAFLDENNNVIEGGAEIPTPKAPLGAKRLLFYLSSTGLTNEELNLIQIEEGTVETSYEPYKEDKKEILIGLDGGLKSLPDGTCDTIEQRKDGVYLVQRVGRTILNGENPSNYSIQGVDPFIVYRYIDNMVSKIGYNPCILSNGLPTISLGGSADINPISIWATDIKEIRIKMYDKSNITLEKGLQWLQANPLTVYYELNAPVETKLDIDNINLQTFKDLTYVTSDNNIEPVLEFKAPILGYKTINPIQLKTTQDGTEVNVYPYSTPELITFGDNETLADKMNNIENTHKHNNATVTTDGFMSKESYSKLESLTNYTHPSTHAATMITEDSTHRFITDTERNNWNAKASTNIATPSTNGLMSNTDKQKIDRISNNFDIVYDANTETIRFRFR